METYIHYANSPFQFDKNRVYPKRYQTGEYPIKPFGFWFSCENIEIENWQNWLQWCLNEQQFLEKLSIRYQVELQDNANILEIRNDSNFIKFCKKYRRKPVPEMYSEFIAWDAVKENYEGMEGRALKKCKSEAGHFKHQIDAELRMKISTYQYRIW